MVAIFSTRFIRAHLHLDSWLEVASTPGAFPFVLLCSAAWSVPLSDTDSSPFGLALGRMNHESFGGMTFVDWVAVL